jgi:hypothetical protein
MKSTEFLSAILTSSKSDAEKIDIGSYARKKNFSTKEMFSDAWKKPLLSI